GGEGSPNAPLMAVVPQRAKRRRTDGSRYRRPRGRSATKAGDGFGADRQPDARALCRADADLQLRHHPDPGAADDRPGLLFVGRHIGAAIRRPRQFPDDVFRSRVLDGADQQHHLDGHLPHHPDPHGTGRGNAAAHHPPRADLLPGRLFPARGDRDGDHGPGLAGHDLQSGDRRFRSRQPARHSRLQPARRYLDGAVRRRHGRSLALVGVPLRHLLRRAPAGAAGADRGGAARGRDLFPDAPLCAAAGHQADHHPDDDPHHHLVVPRLRLRLHPDAGRAGVFERGAFDPRLPARLLRSRRRAGGRRGAGDLDLRARRDLLLRPHPDAGGSAMRLIESRFTMIVTYVVLAIGAFIALFPIALLLLNSIKPALQITVSPLALPAPFAPENFVHAWNDARFSRTFLNSALITAITIVLVCATASLSAYVLARRKIRSWQLWTFYLMATTTAPIQLFLFPLYFVYAHLGLVNNVPAVSVIYTALYSPF